MAVCVLAADDQKTFSTVNMTRAAVEIFFKRPAAHVIIEVGGQSRWVSELLTSLGHSVTVANARQVQLISQSNNKSDRRDCELLARLGRADVKLLAPLQHRSSESQAHLAVARARDVLVRSRTMLINHVRGVMKSAGQRLRKSNADYFVRNTRGEVSVALKAALDPLYDTIAHLTAQIAEQDKMINRIAKQYPDVRTMTEISGIGRLTALVYVLTIEDKNRFAKSRQVGAFLGLRPRKAQSGESDPQLRITKSGDRFLRRLLVGSAQYVLGPFGPESDLRRWGQTLAARGGKNAKKRATVAVARKLAVLLHRLWMTGETYEPTGYSSGHAERRAA